jgi:peptidoglycan hydrolase-like protein with peptidoglycan-binding domain
MPNISGTVGQGGRNQAADVSAVQDLLRGRGFDPGPTNGQCGDSTVAAIRQFQAGFLTSPDGLIEPGRHSWQHLLGESSGTTPAAWQGDSATWPPDKKLASMKPEMARKAKAVMAALAEQGFQPKVVYGWRSVAVQAQLFADGKSKVRFSFHNAQLPDGTPQSYAADIIDSRFAWSAQAESSGFWQALGEAARAQGLVWGGDWAGFRDWAHVQLVANSELSRVMRESGL